jgi:hypothetical protein
MMCSNKSASVCFQNDATHRIPIILSTLIALLALTHTALSQIPNPGTTQNQDWSKLPELPVWYEELNGLGGGLSYLPDFDTDNGGKNALVCNGRVIYNRFKGDTTTMFKFAGGTKVIYGDYNGDGIRDYFTNHYYMYQGLKNATPPSKTFTHYYYDGYSHYAFIANTDFNQDAKDDIIFSASSLPDTASDNNDNSIGSIIVGGDDLTRLEVIKLPFTAKVTNELWQTFEQQYLVDAYFLEGKGLRIITATQLTDRKTFAHSNPQLNLWNVEISGNRGNRVVKYNLLHTLKIPNSTDVSYLSYQPYHNHTGIHAFALYPFTYSLHTDKILLALDKPTFGAGGGSLSSNIRPDKPFTWIASSESAIFDGDPRTTNIPFARLKTKFKIDSAEEGFYYIEHITAIGDIDNDGLNDVAAIIGYSLENRWMFRIYLGVDGTTGVVESNLKITTIEFPQPILSNKPMLLRVSAIEQAQATITLFTQRGETATQLWSGELQQGENIIPFDAVRLGLSRGWYNLRLQIGSKVIDKALIID